MNDTSAKSTAWNPWGWFGGTIGPIVFLPLSAVAVFERSVALSLILLGLFAIPASMAVIFWRSRHSLDVLQALPLALSTDFIAVMAGTYILYQLHAPGPLSGQPVSPHVFYLLPAVYGMTIWQVLRRRKQTQQERPL